MYISDLNYIELLSIGSPLTHKILEYRIESVVGGTTVIVAILDNSRHVGSRSGSTEVPVKFLEIGWIEWTSTINGKFTMNDTAKHTPEGKGFLFLLKMLNTGRFTQQEARRFQLKIKRSDQVYISY